MLGKWFEKALSAGQKPVVVPWSPTSPGHSVHSSEVVGTVKQLSVGEVSLAVCAPKFLEDRTEVSFTVDNKSGKALGFGARGVGLAVTSKDGVVFSLTSIFLERGLPFEPGYEARCQDVLVDVRQEVSITAVLTPASRPERSQLVMQVNRILAAPYLFIVPFEGDAQSEPGLQQETKIIRYFFEVQTPEGQWLKSTERDLFKTPEEADAAGQEWGNGRWPHRVQRIELSEPPWYEDP
jgi:hypothetical protein